MCSPFTTTTITTPPKPSKGGQRRSLTLKYIVPRLVISFNDIQTFSFIFHATLCNKILRFHPRNKLWTSLLMHTNKFVISPSHTVFFGRQGGNFRRPLILPSVLLFAFPTITTYLEEKLTYLTCIQRHQQMYFCSA